MKDNKEKPYALGLTKKEYYRQYEQDHRKERNAYRRKKYFEKSKAQIESIGQNERKGERLKCHLKKVQAKK